MTQSTTEQFQNHDNQKLRNVPHPNRHVFVPDCLMLQVEFLAKSMPIKTLLLLLLLSIFQRWVTQKAILPVQGDPQHRTYIHMYNYTQTNTKGT